MKNMISGNYKPDRGEGPNELATIQEGRSQKRPHGSLGEHHTQRGQLVKEVPSALKYRKQPREGTEAHETTISRSLEAGRAALTQ